MVKPITPEEASKYKENKIPDAVLEAFNLLIAQNWDGHEARIYQKDIVERLMILKSWTSSYIYDNRFLDVENIYRKAGWSVKYDKPGYCETYDAFFVFSKSKNQ